MSSTSTDTPSFPPDKWEDLFKREERFDESDWNTFVNSELLKRRRSLLQIQSICSRTSASLSIIASTLLIAHLLRSHQGLSTTYHRLVFGLCIGDIIHSSFVIPTSLMVPKEMEYMTPGAKGNATTCTTQGFFLVIASLMSQYYYCSICFYHLAIITYNKSDAYIEKKLERWFHIIPITVALLNAIRYVVVKGYNIKGNVCLLEPYDPPHCIGYKDLDKVEGYSIPCGRGSAFYDRKISEIIFIAVVSPTPIIIISTMTMMYWTVFKIERNASRYGVNTLRLRVRREGIENDFRWSTRSMFRQIIQKIQNCISSCWSNPLHYLLTCRNGNSNHFARPDAVARRTRTVSRKKAILQVASRYVAAWASFSVPFLIVTFSKNNESVSLVNSITGPLQGLFNFMVFMSPKISAAKKRPSRRGQQQQSEELRWFQAVYKAYTSRGPRRTRP